MDLTSDDLAGLPLDLPPEVETVLRAAGAAWHDERKTEALVLDALRLAPEALATRLAAYKFYFYRHRLAEALPYAEACVGFAAGRLGLATDWRSVGAGDAAFEQLTPLPKLWLQALTACGYLLARLGRQDEARAALAKVAGLDPADKLGAARMLGVVERGGLDDEEGD